MLNTTNHTLRQMISPNLNRIGFLIPSSKHCPDPLTLVRKRSADAKMKDASINQAIHLITAVIGKVAAIIVQMNTVHHPQLAMNPGQ